MTQSYPDLPHKGKYARERLMRMMFGQVFLVEVQKGENTKVIGKAQASSMKELEERYPGLRAAQEVSV